MNVVGDDPDGREMTRVCLSLFVISIIAKGTEALSNSSPHATNHESPLPSSHHHQPSPIDLRLCNRRLLSHRSTIRRTYRRSQSLLSRSLRHVSSSNYDRLEPSDGNKITIRWEQDHRCILRAPAHRHRFAGEERCVVVLRSRMVLVLLFRWIEGILFFCWLSQSRSSLTLWQPKGFEAFLY